MQGALAVGGGLVCGSSWAADSALPPLTTIDLEVPPFAKGFGTVRVLAPSQSAQPDARSRALVLLHGLGETKREALALQAWPDLYGAISSDARLRQAPLQQTSLQAKYWSAETLDRMNEGLRARPYHGAVLICPRTPNPGESRDRTRLFDDYSAWLCSAVLPAVERHIAGSTRRVGLDGCSLGGYVATEVFLRRPEVFACFGSVQGALGAHRIQGYAERFRELGQTRGCLPLRFASSTQDPFLDVNRAMSRLLTAAGVRHDLDVVPGPHNQPWLREIGTLRTLRWHDLQLAAAPCAGAK